MNIERIDSTPKYIRQQLSSTVELPTVPYLLLYSHTHKYIPYQLALESMGQIKFLYQQICLNYLNIIFFILQTLQACSIAPSFRWILTPFPNVLSGKNSHRFPQLAFTNFPNSLLPGRGTKIASFNMEQVKSLVYTSPKTQLCLLACTEDCLHRCFCFCEAISISFTLLSPLVQLPGTPHLWLKLDFPLKGEVFQSRRNSQRNEYASSWMEHRTDSPRD